MKQYHEIGNIRFVGCTLSMTIDGKSHEFGLSKISTRPANASQLERETFEISPSGYGIHWKLIDEDLSIDGLLGIIHERKHVRETTTTS